MESGKTVVNEINRLKRMYLRTKSLFPYLTDNDVGKRKIEIPRFYRRHGFHDTLMLKRNLTCRDRLNFNSTGHWINGSSIIWLDSILDHFGAYKLYKNELNQGATLDFKLKANFPRVWLVGKLRNVFAHSNGVYDPSNRLHEIAKKGMEEVFPNEGRSWPSKGWPIPVDKVILPLFDACKEFIGALDSASAQGKKR